jgi:predicted permease
MQNNNSSGGKGKDWGDLIFGFIAAVVVWIFLWQFSSLDNKLNMLRIEMEETREACEKVDE